MIKKWFDILIPKKGLLDLIPANLLNPEFSPNVQNMELDEGVVRSRKGYKLNSLADIDPYKTGTVVNTHGSKTVTGIGTVWTTALENGSFTNLDNPENSYIVKTRVGNTEITLDKEFEGETTLQSLAVDTNYASVKTPTTMCWDGTNFWAIVLDTGLYYARKYDTSMVIVSSTLIRSPILYPTGITYFGGSVWVAGKDGTKQYLQNVTGTDVLNSAASDPCYSGSVYAKGYIYHGCYDGATRTFERYNVALNTWESKTLPGADIVRGSKIAYDGVNYLYINLSAGQIHRYSISGDSWENLNISPPSSAFSSLEYYNGYLYAGEFGVLVFKRFYKLNIASKIWSQLSDIPFSQDYILECDTDIVDNYIYFLEGYNGKTFCRFNITDETWEVLPTYPGTAVNTFRQIEYYDGNIYIINGASVVDRSFRMYNVVSGVWSSLADTIDEICASVLEWDGNYLYLLSATGGVSKFAKYTVTANTWDKITNRNHNLGIIDETNVPKIEDIAVVSGSLWSYAGFWNATTGVYDYNLIKHGTDLISFTKYESPSQRKEVALGSSGTNLICSVTKFHNGTLKSLIHTLTPIDAGLIMTEVSVFDTGVVHDEGLGTYIRGICFDGTVIWSCRSTNTTTVQFTKYLAAAVGDTYTTSGVTDNLYTYKKWDGSERLIWSSIPKGMVAVSDNAKDWKILKAGLNGNYHIKFTTYMNYLFVSNGYDDCWCWSGGDASTGSCTSDGLVTTAIDTTFTQVDDYWNGCAIVFTSGANIGAKRNVTDFDAGTDTFTFAALDNITSIGDKFYIHRVIIDPNKITAGDITHDAAKTSMPKGGLLEEFQNRLWTNDKDHPNILRCTGIYFNTDTGMDDTWDALQEFQIANSDILKGLKRAGDRMYVFAEDNTYVLLGSGGFTTYQLIKLDTSVGLLSDKGVSVKENDAIFTGRDGIFQIIGREIKELSQGIKNFFKGIQQTEVYFESWVQSSETEFNLGSFVAAEISVDNGNITLKPLIKTWSVDKDWNDSLVGALYQTEISDNNIGITTFDNDKGIATDTNYLSGNIASQGVFANTAPELRQIIDDNENSYFYSRRSSVINDPRKITSAYFSFESSKDIRKLQLIYKLTSHTGKQALCDLKIMYLDASNVWQTIRTKPEYAEDNYTTQFETTTLNIRAKCFAFSFVRDVDVALSFYELQLFEQIPRITYTSTKERHTDGYIIVKQDSAIANPSWGVVNLKYRQLGFVGDNHIKMQAKVNHEDANWDDIAWEWFGSCSTTGEYRTFSGTPSVAKKRYIQLKVYLYADTQIAPAKYTPNIYSMDINYLNYGSSVFTSDSDDISSEITAWDVFDVKQTTYDDTNLKWEVTSAPLVGDLGAAGYPWVVIIPGTKPTGYFNSAGSTWFQWRVTLSSGTAISPFVESAAVNWLEGGVQVTPICSVMDKHKYYLSLALSDTNKIPSLYNNAVLVINKEANYEVIKGLNASGFAVYKNRLYAGASDSGFIYLLDEGYSDNGNAIESYVETIDYDFKMENNLKNLLQIYCEGKLTSEDFKIQYSFDSGNTWGDIDIDVSVLKSYEFSGDTFHIRRYVPIGKQGKKIRFRVYGSTTDNYIEIHKLRALILPTGIIGE